MRRIVYSSGFALLLVFLAVSAPNAAEAGFLRNPDGTITELVTPDGQTTIPMSINNSGMINGLTYQNTYFIRDVSGNYTTFAPPSPYILYGSWINSSGEVAGSYIGHTTPYQAFIRDTSGNITTFAVDAPGILPGDQETAVRGITDSGTVVGFNLIPPTGGSVNPSTEGFIRDASGNITNVFIPGSSSTQISAANGNGDVAGTFTTTDGLIHGFYRTSSGVVTLFDATNNETVLNVSAVNNSGVITGFAYGSSAGGHAFVRDASGNITSFNVAGSTTNAYGIVEPRDTELPPRRFRQHHAHQLRHHLVCDWYQRPRTDHRRSGCPRTGKRGLDGAWVRRHDRIRPKAAAGLKARSESDSNRLPRVDAAPRRVLLFFRRGKRRDTDSYRGVP